MCSPGMFENIKSEKSNYEKAKNIMAYDDSYDPYAGAPPMSPGVYGSSGEWDLYDRQAQEYQIVQDNEQIMRDNEAYIKNRNDETQREQRAVRQSNKRRNSLEIPLDDDDPFTFISPRQDDDDDWFL